MSPEFRCALAELWWLQTVVLDAPVYREIFWKRLYPDLSIEAMDRRWCRMKRDLKRFEVPHNRVSYLDTVLRNRTGHRCAAGGKCQCGGLELLESPVVTIERYDVGVLSYCIVEVAGSNVEGCALLIALEDYRRRIG